MPGSAIDTEALKVEMERVSDEVMKEAAGRWFTASQKRLNGATSQRANIDSEGRVGRQENALQAILQSGQPPQWDESRGAYVFSYTHMAAIYHEYGTRPHEIEAKQAEFLAFEWPDAPQEVKEMFEDTFPLVFFKKIEHPGNPAIGFVRHGRAVAEEFLEEQSTG